MYIYLGDDGAVQPSHYGGGGTTETEGPSATFVSGERVAARRVVFYATTSADQRAECGATGGGEETSRVHELIENI